MNHIDAESVETREYWYQKLYSLLKRVGMGNGFNNKQKVERFKNNDFNGFMDLLAGMNWSLRWVPALQRRKNEIAYTIVPNHMEPPEHADKELETVFNEIKSTISEDNITASASKLYLGIVFSHLFPDGNGRTARNIYFLMTRWELPPKELITNRPKWIGTFCTDISTRAMYKCFVSYGVKVKQPEEIVQYYTLEWGVSTNIMDHLKYLAIREISYNHNTQLGNTFELTNLPSDQRKEYQEKYNKIKHDWYSEIQKTVDEHPERVIDSLEGCLS